MKCISQVRYVHQNITHKAEKIRFRVHFSAVLFIIKMQLPRQTVLVRSSQDLLLVHFSSSSEDAQQILALYTEQSDVTMSSIRCNVNADL